MSDMSKAGCNIRVGTSGWYYDHWKELFYPDGLAKNKWLEHYAEHFDTVEVNNTFYHLPKEQTLLRWQKIAPKGFLYAVKANRYITHIKKLAESHGLFWKCGAGCRNSTESVNVILSPQYLYVPKLR